VPVDDGSCSGGLQEQVGAWRCRRGVGRIAGAAREALEGCSQAQACGRPVGLCLLQGRVPTSVGEALAARTGKVGIRLSRRLVG
jgi:hypothetical protein